MYVCLCVFGIVDVWKKIFGRLDELVVDDVMIGECNMFLVCWGLGMDDV